MTLDKKCLEIEKILSKTQNRQYDAKTYIRENIQKLRHKKSTPKQLRHLPPFYKKLNISLYMSCLMIIQFFPESPDLILNIWKVSFNSMIGYFSPQLMRHQSCIYFYLVNETQLLRHYRQYCIPVIETLFLICSERQLMRHNT